MGSDIAVFAVAAGCWIGFVYKLHHLRHRANQPGRSALRALVIALGLVAGIFTLTPHLVAQTLDPLAGLPGTTRLAANIVAMAACLSIMGWLIYLTQPEEQARIRMVVHRRVLAVAVVAVLVLFGLDHPPIEPGVDFGGIHNYLFLLYIAYAVAAQMRLTWRYASMVQAPLMRLGLRMVTGSSALGLIFITVELAYLIDRDLQIGIPGLASVGRLSYTAGAILFIIGLTLPAWGPRVGLEALWWRTTRRLATRRLRPLWTTLTREYPGVVLSRELLAAAPHGERLAAGRLPVEINDAWLHLRCHLTPAHVELIDRLAGQKGIPEGDLALIAAARLMVAIHCKNTADGPRPTAAPPIEHLGTGSSTTLLDEVRFLGEVSRKLTSRFVHDVMTHVRAAADVAQQPT